MTRLEIFAAASIGCAGVLLSGQADAHFVLQSPTNWVSQTTGGAPQKTAPCGNEGGGTPSNIVTPYRPGDLVTVMLNEPTPHPGWYKAVLSTNGQGGLPADPTPTPGTSACGDVSADGGISALRIQNPPVFPVLADGAIYHTAPLSGTRSFSFNLPTNVTCTNCVLQIVEYMADHGAPCFYHHCANISIQGAPVDGGTTTGTGGTTGAADAGRDSAATGGAGGATGSGGTSGTGGASATGTGGASATGTGGASATGTGGASATGTGGSGQDAATGGQGGTGSTGLGGSGGGTSGGGGCACAFGPTSPPLSGGLAGLFLALIVARRRRCRSHRLMQSIVRRTGERGPDRYNRRR